MQQHVRALKTLGCELPSKFITSMIVLKLDVDTLFEWQKHSQTRTSHIIKISLTFGLNLMRPLTQRKPREYPGMISTSGNHKARWSPLTLLVPTPPTAIVWSVRLTNILCMFASHYPMKTISQS